MSQLQLLLLEWRTGTTAMVKNTIGLLHRWGCILSPCLFNLYAEYIMRNAGLMKHKMESRLPGEVSIISDMQMTPPLLQRMKRNFFSLDESERREWTSWLKTQHSKNEDHSIWSHLHGKDNGDTSFTSWQTDGETMQTVKDFILGRLQNHYRGWLQPWN